MPNSVVDPSVNPTQVIATFEGTLRSAMGNAVLDGTLHPPAYSPEFEDLYPWRKEQNGLDEDNNSTEKEVHETSTSTSETQDTDARQTTLKMLTTEAPPEQTTFDLSTTETNDFPWTIPMIPDLNDHPLEIFVKSTSAAPIIRPASERSGRRLADQIIDVMTEELTLRPVDELSTTEDQLSGTAVGRRAAIICDIIQLGFRTAPSDRPPAATRTTWVLQSNPIYIDPAPAPLPAPQQPYIPQPQPALVPQAPQIPQYTGKG
ncbi:unnamed protein product [Cylicocyclus nassatus]|uniref:Uncharacterized protein n=1 Tax=Cylicocyclus nassatus TaxID=53992 RepID=A0AA36GKP4_CYLNA|nr:unnamed protein product [Cylicocyclus nassatus]